MHTLSVTPDRRRSPPTGERDKYLANQERILFYEYGVPWAAAKRFRRDIEAATQLLIDSANTTE
ncbi:MAG: hypothetical protein QM662_10920 [Gordonia sp. (in: high G+C Gram-positive bacteria)]